MGIVIEQWNRKKKRRRLLSDCEIEIRETFTLYVVLRTLIYFAREIEKKRQKRNNRIHFIL